MEPIHQIQKINTTDERWKTFVESVPDATIFHHPAWVNLLAECYRYRAFVIALCNEAGKISAGLPTLDVNSFLTGRRWTCLPFTDYCSPLTDHPENFKRFTQALLSLPKENGVPPIEVRWQLPVTGSTQTDVQFVRHTIDLNQGIDSISKSLHRTQRQNIRTAEKNNVQIKRGEDLDALRVFYHLHSLTRRRQGVPVQPWRFFELVQKRLIENGMGFILLAYAEDQCLAAGLFLHWNKTLVYKYAASGDTGHDMRPNHLLTWTALNWGCEQGFKLFDFGRTDADNEGLRTFKNRWGASETSLAYTTLPSKSQSSSSGKLETVMHTILQKSPVWVCQFAGNVLYRHFG